MIKELPTHIVAVSGIVENEKNEVLLVRNHMGEWTWTGGQVENEENLIDALLREILEESGILAEVKTLFAVSSNTSSHPGYNGYEVIPTKVMLDFACKYTGGKLLQSTDETCEARRMKKDHALELLTLPNLAERYEAFLQFRGQVRYLSYATHPEYRLNLKRNI